MGGVFFFEKSLRVLVYVRKKLYLCRENARFAAFAGENMLKNI